MYSTYIKNTNMKYKFVFKPNSYMYSTYNYSGRSSSSELRRVIYEVSGSGVKHERWERVIQLVVTVKCDVQLVFDIISWS